MSAELWCWSAAAGKDGDPIDYMESIETDNEDRDFPEMGQFLDELLARFPDTSSENTVWTFAPVRRGLSRPGGPLISLHLTWDAFSEVADTVTTLAAKHNIICYDPQEGAFIGADKK